MKKFLLVAVLFVGLAFSNNAEAQKVAIKTNLLYDATANMSLGLEFGIAPKWTLNIEGTYNPFTFSDGMRWKNLTVQPELRYWTCNRFAGHFFALHGVYGTVDWSNIKPFFGLKMGSTDWELQNDLRNDGWVWSVGLGYGYDWVLSKHWNLEFELVLGYVGQYYDKWRVNKAAYPNYKDDYRAWHKYKDGSSLQLPNKVDWPDKKNQSHDWYIGPTKAAITLVYVF